MKTVQRVLRCSARMQQNACIQARVMGIESAVSDAAGACRNFTANVLASPARTPKASRQSVLRGGTQLSWSDCRER
jgi:hypothetical protein